MKLAAFVVRFVAANLMIDAITRRGRVRVSRLPE